MNKKKKYIALFVIKQEGTYSRVGKKRFNPKKDSIRFKGGRYLINSAHPTYIRGLKLYYFVDIEGEANICFAKTKGVAISPQIVDMIISKKIVSQLTTNLSTGALRMSILTLLIGVLLGGAFGYIISGFF